MDDIEAELNISAAHFDSPGNETTNEEIIKNPLHIEAPNKYYGQSKETGFHRSSRKCLKIIRDAMLHHNWQKAAEYFTSYIQTLEDTTVTRALLTRDVTWRLGAEILHHLTNASIDDFNAVYEIMKNTGVSNYAKICLEQAFHLLLNGESDEAKRQLSSASHWRYGKRTDAQSLEMKLIHAYCGFLDYFIWSKKISTTSETDDVHSLNEISMYFRQASVTLSEIIKQPGIWDPFVLSYITMLEHNNSIDEALKVLQNYAYNKEFPSNPNAHVYLYQFLKRHNAPPSALISSLRILHSVVPSHKLMLDFCSLLLKEHQETAMKEALLVCMDLLEYSSWKCDRDAWKCLLKILQRPKNEHNMVKEEWAVRRSLWMAFHFRPYIIRMESQKDVRLWRIKERVLKLLGEDLHTEDFRKSPSGQRDHSEDYVNGSES
ncbi:TATA box-binding protein-associated factor RNA polymerase I subunit A isoform X1 [Triplophysa dalaica]|uniref:TATA box-binding protein-associated factor RNA polymerase I subunit A isoform X1 n=2 Tax=Triplophysa dalaica TaxID=1582913 RepID=UPI0024DF5F14|nr:TATA box-binding protein-associated factor RNA polymerase I subunit A isoform X1 [Triplophysa dalaica]